MSMASQPHASISSDLRTASIRGSSAAALRQWGWAGAKGQAVESRMGSERIESASRCLVGNKAMLFLCNPCTICSLIPH